MNNWNQFSNFAQPTVWQQVFKMIIPKKKHHKIFFERESLILFFFINICLCLFTFFLIYLSIPSALFGISFLIIIIYKTNHIISIDKNLNILSKFFIPKTINLSAVTKISYEQRGIGSKTDYYVVIYYHEGKKINQSVLLHYRIFNKKNIVHFLNSVNDTIIDKKSFEQLKIKFISEKFS